MTTTDHTKTGLEEKLSYLKLSFMRENYESLAKKAAQKQWTHVNYLTELATAEGNLRQRSCYETTHPRRTLSTDQNA